MSGPQRAVTLEIRLGADTWEHMLHALNEIQRELAGKEPGEYRVASGGVDWGHHYSTTYNPEMTHDLYFALLDAHLDSIRTTRETKAD